MRKTVSWLAVLGAILSLGGSFVLVADQWPPFHALYNSLSQYGAIEQGWKRLDHYTVADRDGNPYAQVIAGQQGFSEIARIIAAQTDALNVGDLSGIIAFSPSSFSLGSGTVHQEYVAAVRSESHAPDLIATKETVAQWLAVARLQSVLFWGFLIILTGVAMSVPSLVRTAILATLSRN